MQEIDYGTPRSLSEKTVTLSIDGKQISVPEGTSIMRAAMEAGIEIPKLCATDMLDAFGSCRLCLIEIDGRAGTPASCTTPVAEGIVVHTKNERLDRIRKGVMELYVSDHSVDSLDRTKYPDVDLLETAAEVGLQEVRYGFAGARHRNPGIDDSNPYFAFDPAKCIVCSRCVRACEEVQGTFALTISGRGFDSIVAAGMDEKFIESECVSCGACVQACPTGSLIEKTVIEKGKPEWSAITTCAYCGVGCAFKAEMRGDEVVRMVPYKDGKANRGHSCVKGRFAWGYANHRERILKPMLREKITEPWREVSWPEAIGRVASEFKRIQAKYGRGSVGGITSSRCTDEETFLVQKLVRAAFGNNNVDTCARVCHSPTGYGLKHHVRHLRRNAGFRFRRACRRRHRHRRQSDRRPSGVRLTDEETFAAGRQAHRHRSATHRSSCACRTSKRPIICRSCPAPTSPCSAALAHVIVTEGLVDEKFVRERCEWDAFQDWAAFVAQEHNSPEAVAKVTGVPAETIRAAARLYATGGNGAIYYGLGITEHSQGSTAVMAIANLAMATGNIGRPGVGVNPLRGQNNVQGSCDMGSFPHELSGYRHIADDATRAMFEALWRKPLDPEPGLRIPNMLDAAVDGTFKAIYIQGEDILQSDPDTHHVAAGLAAMECVVVQDLFLNETANYAHVFLPGSTFLEKDGTFINAERRIQLVRKVMEPKPGYADWEITCAISDAMGYPMHYNHRVGDHGRDRAPDADLRRRLVPTGRGAWLDPVAVQREGAGGHAGDAHERLRARQGQVRRHRIYRHRREDRPALPAAADDRAHPVPV